MPVRGFRGQPVYGSQPYIVTADPKRELRLFTVKRDWSTTPKEEGVTGHWSELSPKEVGDFSAVAYFFGDLFIGGCFSPKDYFRLLLQHHVVSPNGS